MPVSMRGLFVLVLVVAGQFGFGAIAKDRIVSVGGDITEIIYALGAGERIVATDSTSVYLAVNETPKVGHLRRLSAEGVLSVEPDLILISGAGTETAAHGVIKLMGGRECVC